MATIQHRTWKSGEGYDQECWDVLRDSFKIGSISHCPYLPDSAYSMKYQAMTTNSYRARYFVRFEAAVKWLERTMRNVYPISEISNLIY